MTPTTPLDHALAYAALGWRVAPIAPGTKWPRIDAWETLATTDPTTITGWWRTTDGVSIVTGAASGLVVIDIDPRHGGDEGWAQLEAAHGEVDTVEALTGGGGRHLYFAMPDGVTITNAAAANLPAGIDVRGEGGQVVAAPTIHPTSGQPYSWEIAHDPLDGYPVADLPPWLHALLTRPIPEQTPRAEPVPYDGVDSIVDLFASRHTWPELLQADGWTFHSRRTTPAAGEYEMWTRPGKDVREGPSATLYYLGSDVLKVWTDQAAPLKQEATYTRFGYWSEVHHGGDFSAAGRAYRRSIPSDGVVGVGKPVTTRNDSVQVPVRERPVIIHNGRQLDDLTAQATRALITNNHPPHLFVRSGQLSRLRQDEDDRPIIEGLRTEHCRLELAEAAYWYKTNKDGDRTSTSPPLDVAATILAAGEWTLPALAGVVELPVLRPDGTFATEHGYDPATRLYHWHHGDPYPPISTDPTADELAAAVALIDEMLCDFPWDSTADRANAWALLLTPLIRAIVGQVPMALVDAPEPGTGKGLLIKLMAIITIGRPAALMAWPTTDEELEKKVSATLMAGNTMVIFDNVEGMIKSPTLAAVLTADIWQGRVLGRSEIVTINNKATWAATGNNIDVGGDLARRCYRIRLDAHQAQPWKRTGFKHADLEGWVAGNRSELLHALCTIVRSWWQAGRPLAGGISAMGGYTSWVRNIGGILEHAGVGDFLANLAEFHASADREAQAWETFLGMWTDEVGEQSLTVAQLINRMADTYTGQRWREVLPEDLMGYWDTPGFSRRLSLALRRRCGRHYGDDGLHLVEMPRDRTKVAVYAVTTRGVEMFDGDPRATPADDDAVTWGDSATAGVAVVVPVLRARESYPQEGFSGSSDPNNFRDSRTPAGNAYDPNIDEEF